MKESSTDFNSTQKMYTLRTELPPLPEGYPISAKVVLDSISEAGQRITTLELVFPRYILAELNTHRVLSKNTSSSRAIPTKKLIEDSLRNAVFPVRMGKNQPGMSAQKENLTGPQLQEALEIWWGMACAVAEGCQRLTDLGLHKQWASRPIEWFTTSKVVVTTTEVDNFFMLRDHHAAQDEMCYLAQAWKVAINQSIPQVLEEGQWHLPYVSKEEEQSLGITNALKVSAARCARTSYKTHHGVTSTLEDDVALFTKLVHDVGNEGEPFHASPTEHQATPEEAEDSFRGYIYLCGNFQGWKQHRKYIEYNLIKHF